MKQKDVKIGSVQQFVHMMARKPIVDIAKDKVFTQSDVTSQ